MVNIRIRTEETRKQFNRAKKGISPVVATVILVAVAVVIAAALAGFSSSLFGTYSSTGAVSIRTMDLTVTTAPDTVDGQMTIVNKGGAADSVLSVAIRPNLLATPAPGTTTIVDFAVGTNLAGGPIWRLAPTITSCGTAPYTLGTTSPDVPANSESIVCFETGQTILSASGALTAGQQVTATIKMKSGAELTQSVTIQP